MADFLNHLIQRSGISPTGKENVPLLQPRLPSLFEAPANADELSVLSASGRMSDSHPEVVPPPVQVPSLEKKHVRAVTSQAESLTVSRAAFSNPPETSMYKKTAVAETEIQGGEPKIVGEQLSRPDKTPSSTIITPAASRMAPLKPVYIVQSRQTGMAARSKERGMSAPVPEDAPAPRGSVEDSQRGPDFSGSERAEGSLNGPEAVKQTAADGPVSRQVIRPRVESARPDPVSATSQTMAASLSNGQTPAEETVVQIRIGRIDVHAAQPSASNQPTRTTAPQPKMTLEDYLRSRENQR